MTDCKRISVIIPCYNHERYIEKTIFSALNQTYQNIEVLVADDHSTDSSAEVIKRIRDSRLKTFFFEENHGTVYALNYLTTKASGDYIAILGSDDYFAPDKLEKQLQIMENTPSLGAVFSWAKIIDENDAPYSGGDFPVTVFEQNNRSRAQWLRSFFTEGNCLCHSSAMIRRSVHEEIGLYHVAFRQLHDFDLWVRLLAKYPIEIIPEQLTFYRRETQCNSVSAASSANTFRLYNEYNAIFLWLFKNIDRALFVETFRDIISEELITDSKSLSFEKYKVLRQMKLGGCHNKSAAISYFVDCIDDTVFSESSLLESRELVNLLYEDTAGAFPGAFMDSIMLANRCNHLESTLNDILNSQSWKITKPLRVFSLLVRKLLGHN